MRTLYAELMYRRRLYAMLAGVGLLLGLIGCNPARQAEPAAQAARPQHGRQAQSNAWQLAQTNDPLYDRLEQAAVAKLKPLAGQPPVRPTQINPVVDSTETAKWETDYSNDSRYWQLCYWAGVVEFLAQQEAQPPAKKPNQPAAAEPAPGTAQPPAAGQPPASGERKHEEQQNAVAAAGGDTPASKKVKPVLLSNIVFPRELLQPLLKADELQIASADTYTMLYEAELCAMDAKATIAQRQPMLAWLDKAAHLDPDLSWSYYLRALHHLDILPGETVDWLAVAQSLTTGNAARRNARPLLFPHSFIETALENHGDGAGCPELGGAILAAGEAQQEAVPLYDTLARATRRVAEQVEQTRDIKLAQEYTRFLCRFGQMQEASLADKQAVARALRIMAHCLAINITQPQYYEQREDLYKTEQWMIDAGLLAYQLERSLATERLMDFADEYRAEVQQDAAQPDQSAYWADMDDYPRSLSLERRWASMYRLRLAELEALDYRYGRLLFNIARFDVQMMRLPMDLTPSNKPKPEKPYIPGKHDQAADYPR